MVRSQLLFFAVGFWHEHKIRVMARTRDRIRKGVCDGSVEPPRAVVKEVLKRKAEVRKKEKERRRKDKEEKKKKRAEKKEKKKENKGKAIVVVHGVVRFCAPRCAAY